MALSNTISLIFIISITIIGFIDCVIGIKFGPEIREGRWNSTCETSFPLTIGDKHYIFGIDGNSTGKFWHIRELGKDGSLALQTSGGTWRYHVYNRVFPFTIDHKQFIFGIRDHNYWFIQEILPGGLMGSETSNGYWTSLPTIIFPFHIGGKHHVFSLTGTDWFIMELLPNGTMGSQTDTGSWNFTCTLGFPFWIAGRQYFYCSEVNHWFIWELLYGGKMGRETANGQWMTNHRLYVPFSIDHRYYFYAASNGAKKSWIVRELLPGGKMGSEKAQGLWQDHFDLSFTSNIEGRQFFYRVNESSWLIQEIIQEPRLPTIDLATSRKNHCDVKKVSRRKRQNDGTCNPHQCQTINLNDSISAIEAYFSSIEDDVNDGCDVFRFSSDIDPVTLVATFRVPPDADHSDTSDLTALIRAEIYRRHMPQQRESIPPEIYEYLQQMDQANYDQAGQLLASSLGGINLPFNFAPQSPTLNGTTSLLGSTTPQSGWYAVEKMLNEYLIETPGNAYIRWTLAPIYSLLPNINSRRPTNFLLTVRFYDARNKPVNWRGKGDILYFNFLNAPLEACKNASNHPWWYWSNPN